MPRNKLKEFKQILKDNNLDGFIVTNPTNIFYLTAFCGMSQTEREVYLVFCPNPTLIAPRLYQKEALKLRSRSLKIVIAKERNGLLGKSTDLLKKCKRIGFEENDLRYGEYEKISNNIKLPLPDLIESMRMIKDKNEIAKIEKAQQITQKAFFAVIKTIKAGQTETEIANKLETIIKSHGAEGLAFPSIVASGPNSGIPHHLTGNKRLAIHDSLIMDFGAKFQNYCADFSRTIFIGKATGEQKNIYMHVQTAQEKALKIVQHGQPHEAYHAANNHFKSLKLEKYFLHGLGHGIGLEVHEKPYLRAKLPTTHDQLLTNGMVFSVEPGLYFPWGGVRIEDLVALDGGKTKVLGKLSKGIIEVR